MNTECVFFSCKDSNWCYCFTNRLHTCVETLPEQNYIFLGKQHKPPRSFLITPKQHDKSCILNVCLSKVERDESELRQRGKKWPVRKLASKWFSIRKKTLTHTRSCTPKVSVSGQRYRSCIWLNCHCCVRGYRSKQRWNGSSETHHISSSTELWHAST